jgi:hypothetical protein
MRSPKSPQTRTTPYPNYTTIIISIYEKAAHFSPAEGTEILIFFRY